MPCKYIIILHHVFELTQVNLDFKSCVNGSNSDNLVIFNRWVLKFLQNMYLCFLILEIKSDILRLHGYYVTMKNVTTLPPFSYRGQSPLAHNWFQ